MGDAHSGSLGRRLWRRQRNCITLAGSFESHDASAPDMCLSEEKGFKNIFVIFFIFVKKHREDRDII